MPRSVCWVCVSAALILSGSLPSLTHSPAFSCPQGTSSCLTKCPGCMRLMYKMVYMVYMSPPRRLRSCLHHSDAQPSVGVMQMTAGHRFSQSGFHSRLSAFTDKEPTGTEEQPNSLTSPQTVSSWGGTLHSLTALFSNASIGRQSQNL